MASKASLEAGANITPDTFSVAVAVELRLMRIMLTACDTYLGLKGNVMGPTDTTSHRSWLSAGTDAEADPRK